MNAREMMTAPLAAIAAAFALAACNELPQDGPKPFAAEDETRSYAGAVFDGDPALYEKALADRTKTQNDYLTVNRGS